MSAAARASAPARPTGSPAGAPTPAPLWTRDFITVTGINFLIMVNYYMLMVVMTSYALAEYDAPASLAGLCASVFIIGALVARFAASPLMERLGRKRILIIGVVVEVAFSCLYLMGVGLWPLMVIRLVHGFAYGVGSTTTSTIATSIIPAERKGEGVGYYMLSATLGAALGPSLGIFVSQSVSYPVLFVAGAVIAAAGLLAALSLKVPEPTFARRDAAGEAAARKPHGIGAALELSIVPISLVCTIIFFGYSSLLTFMTPYATELGLAQAASVFFVVYALFMFITRPFTGKIFDRRGPHPAMVPAFASFAVGMAVLAATSNAAMLLIAAALLGFAVGTIQSCGLAMAVQHTPDERLSRANATFFVFLDTGVGIGPLALGAVLPMLGYRNLYVAMVVVGLVGFALYLIVSRRRR